MIVVLSSRFTSVSTIPKKFLCWLTTAVIQLAQKIFAWFGWKKFSDRHNVVPRTSTSAHGVPQHKEDVPKEAQPKNNPPPSPRTFEDTTVIALTTNDNALYEYSTCLDAKKIKWKHGLSDFQLKTLEHIREKIPQKEQLRIRAAYWGTIAFHLLQYAQFLENVKIKASQKTFYFAYHILYKEEFPVPLLSGHTALHTLLYSPVEDVPFYPHFQKGGDATKLYQRLASMLQKLLENYAKGIYPSRNLTERVCDLLNSIGHKNWKPDSIRKCLRIYEEESATLSLTELSLQQKQCFIASHIDQKNMARTLVCTPQAAHACDTNVLEAIISYLINRPTQTAEKTLNALLHSLPDHSALKKKHPIFYIQTLYGLAAILDDTTPADGQPKRQLAALKQSNTSYKKLQNTLQHPKKKPDLNENLIQLAQKWHQNRVDVKMLRHLLSLL